jgi:hypothetical protein
MAMKALVWGGIVLAVLFCTDRILLWMERCGWIHWRKTKASPGSAAGAFLEIHANLEPGKRHVIEQRFGERTEEDDQGGPDDPAIRKPE